MRTPRRLAYVGLAVVISVLATALPASAAPGGGGPGGITTTTPIHHFIFLMQGDRTFDNYFGTYPGADGIPDTACQQLVLNRPQSGCVQPFALNGSTPAPLTPGASVINAQLDSGKMDGFVAAFAAQGQDGTTAMGYYDQRDLPYYWNLAQSYVLFDRFFSSVPYGYRANRSYWVSAAPQPGGGDSVSAAGYGNQLTIFDRLNAAGISWKFYVQDYQPSQTFRARTKADPASQTVRVPLLNYARFVDDPQLNSHIADLNQYYKDLADGTLPAVAYVASSGSSERSARSIPAGQTLVHSMVTQLMLSRFWSSSAFMWSYDGSGGWYDHVQPPRGFGLRVPALLVSPYAKHGQVNSTTLDYTSALKFIEQNWGLAALTSRDAHAASLTSAFNFAAAPRPADIVGMTQAQDHTPLVDIGVIYVWYGGAAAVGLVCIAVAAVTSDRRRRRSASTATPVRREEVTVA
jgi:phospholipase C